MRKFISAIIASVMIVCSVPAMAETVIDSDTKNIIVSGTAKNGASVVTILLKDKSNNVTHVDEANVIDGKFFCKFKLKNIDEYDLFVNAGGEDVTKDATVSKVVDKKFDAVISFSGTNANKYFNAGDSIALNAKVKNMYADDAEYTLIFACYDQNGKLIGAIEGDTNVVGYGESGEIWNSNELTSQISADTAVIKAFAWTDELYPIAISKQQSMGDKSYQDKDTITFIGDSITHIGIYPRFIEHYYQTRYPDRDIAFYNKGISGEAAYHVVKRFDWDIVADGANRATIMMGVNDIGGAYTGDNPGANEDDCMKTHLDSYKTIIDKCKENDIELTIVTPVLVDKNNCSLENPEYVNEGLKTLSTRVKALAEEEGLTVYDINTISNEITTNANTNGVTDVIQSADGVHPTNTGYTILGYSYLIEQGVSDTVARVEINADTTVTDNCTVTDLSYTAGGVSFTYSPKAIPLAANANYTNAEALLAHSNRSITEELNNEIIKVTGLEEGTYTINLDGNAAATCTASELAEGINIATLEANPNQANAKAAYKKVMLEDQECDKLRDIAITQAWKGSYNIDTDAGYAAFLEKYSYHPYLGYFKRYAEYKPIEDEIKANAKAYAEEAKALSQPKTYTITITK